MPPSSINEAEVEVRIDQAIRAIFPSFNRGRIRHQTTFQIKLGRGKGTVQPSIKKGILDIYLEVDGKPLAILELKRPGEILDEEVSRQGLSYARLIDSAQLPPLVITSNGQETKFFQTWDGAPWKAESADEVQVQELFAKAGKVATASIDEAVLSILSKVPDAWEDAIRDLSAEELEAHRGDLSQLTKTLPRDFRIPRKATYEIATALANGQSKISLVGDIVSGKSNVLAELCEHPLASGHCFLYVDISYSSEGIMERIAAAMRGRFFLNYSSSGIKEWLRSRLEEASETKLVLLIDGLDFAGKEIFQQDLDFLCRLADDKRLSVVFACHPETAQSISTIGGTSKKSRIGNNLGAILLAPLDDEEFMNACALLANERKISIESFSRWVAELRDPRIFRMLVSLYPPQEEGSESCWVMLDSNLSANWFDRAWKQNTSPDLYEAYHSIACGLRKSANDGEDPEGMLRAKIWGAISKKVADSELPQDELRYFREAGLLSLVSRPNGLRFYVPQVPEMVVFAASLALAQETQRILQSRSAQEAARHLVSEAYELPYDAITGALALKHIAAKNDQAADLIINHLLSVKPSVDQLGIGASVLAMTPDGDTMTIDLGEIPEFLESNPPIIWNLEWMVLSYFLGLDGTSMSMERRLNMIKVLAASRIPLHDIRQSKRNFLPGVHEHELPGGSTVLCGSQIYLEPLMLPVSQAFIDYPSGMEAICLEAVEQEETSLLYRLVMALDRIKNSVGFPNELSRRNLPELLNAALGQALGSTSLDFHQ